MIATWNHGIDCNAAGFLALQQGGGAMDMVEAGARIVEADGTGLSVGIGGLPDRDGHVTLDACCMDETGNAGSVCFVQNLAHPLSLARKVMEDTPHVMLAGAGAEQYARELGMDTCDLLTEQSRQAWMEWRKTSNYAPVINIENHDTIGIWPGRRGQDGRRLHHKRAGVQDARVSATVPSWGQASSSTLKSAARPPQGWVKR